MPTISRAWHVFSRSALEDENIVSVIGSTNHGEPYVPVFSRPDLAASFLDRMADPDAVAVEMTSLEKWGDVLVDLYADGHRYIALDPEPGKSLQLTTIWQVAESLKQGAGSS